MCFGGEENPLRAETEVTTGDVVAIPAGVDPACWRIWKGNLRWWVAIRKAVAEICAMGRKERKRRLRGLKALSGLRGIQFMEIRPMLGV